MAARPQRIRKHRQAQLRQTGFSLVEVLVTLSVTALASVLIVLSARPSDPLRQEQDRLFRIIGQLEAQARVSGIPSGLLIERNSYVPARWTDGNWQVSERDRQIMPGKIVLHVNAVTEGGPQVVFDPLMPHPQPVIALRDGQRELRVTTPRKVGSL
jgi:prepilin-type N-terminal cleavage/methylation domain-containing protein